MRIDFHIAAVKATPAPGSLKIHGGAASMNSKSRRSAQMKTSGGGHPHFLADATHIT